MRQHEDLKLDVRGTGRRGFYSQVRDLLTNHKPDVLMSMGTGFSSNRALVIVKRIHTSNFIEIPPIDFLEGFWLFWKDNAVLKL